MTNASKSSGLIPEFRSGPVGLVEDAKSYRQKGMERIGILHRNGAPGREVVKQLTELMDDLIRGIYNALFSEAGAPFPVIAVGGYGRGELNPCSDIDLLLLCGKPDSAEIRKAAEQFLYPLWDLKLEVGHSVRTVKSCLSMAKADDTVLTSLLQARTVAGNPTPIAKLWERMEKKILPKAAPKLLKAKVDEIQGRRGRFGDSVYILEPNVKESPGGLRDLHTAIWASSALHNAHNMDELERGGFINHKDRGRLESALDFFWTVRNELHLSAGRKEDRLTFSNQERIALFMNYRDRTGRKAVEHFMRDYYLHADALRHFTDRLLEEALVEISGPSRRTDMGDGFYLSDGKIYANPTQKIGHDREKLPKIFQIAAQHNARLSPTLLHAIHSGITDEVSSATQPANKAIGWFWRLFQKGHGIHGILEDMHDAGMLGMVLPEFEALRRQVQHDAYHIYTTDLHCIFTVKELEDILDGKVKGEKLFTEIAREIKDWPLMLLAGLLHDIGKGFGKGHSKRGADMMPIMSRRMGLDAAQTEMLTFLVAQHLEMAQTSQKRDMDDPGLIKRFAKHVGSEERLKMLALLTVADQRAVGQREWNDWKRALLSELYLKVVREIEKGSETWVESEKRIDRVRLELEKLLEGAVSPKRLDFNARAMPRRFFMTRSPESIARVLKVIEGLGDKDIMATAIHHDAALGHTEFILSAWDAPGIFTKIAGILSANGVNILKADIYTRSDGVVFDTFWVNDPGGGPVLDDNRWKRVENDLDGALSGELEVADKVARCRKPLITARRPPYKPPRVEFDLAPEEKTTILEVYAHDRVGLLYDITQTFSELGLYIDRAIVATEVDQAADIFYVKDIFGHKITEQEKLDKIRQKLIEALREAEKSEGIKS